MFASISSAAAMCLVLASGQMAPMVAMAQMASPPPSKTASAPAPVLVPGAVPASAPTVFSPGAAAAAPIVLPAKNTPDGQGIATGPVAGPVHPPNAPLKFDTTSHDFGKIPDNKPVSFDFTFTNTTDKVVNILNVAATCGCTSAISDKQIQPGEKGKITASFNPSGRNGREVKTLTAYLDDAATPQLQFQVIADVQKRLIIEPMQAYMGEVNFKTSREQQLTITGRAENFEITKAEVVGTGFTLTRIGADKVDVNGESLNRITYKVVSDASLPIGRAQANANFTTTDPLAPTASVALIADVAGAVRINPPQVGVRMSGPGEPFSADVFLENREAKSFSILGVEFEPAQGLPPGTDLRPIVDVTRREPTSKAAYRVRLAGTTPGSANELRGTLRVKTDVPDQEEIIIAVSGFMVAGAVPNAVKGGAVPINPAGPAKLQPGNQAPTKPMLQPSPQGAAGTPLKRDPAVNPNKLTPGGRGQNDAVPSGPVQTAPTQPAAPAAPAPAAPAPAAPAPK